MVTLFGCTTPVSQDGDSKLIETVKIMEQNEHQLRNFEITYDQYKKNTDEFLYSNSENMENEDLFVLKGKEFRGSDLAGVSQNEMIQLKEEVENALKDSLGKPQYDVIYISDVYSDDKKDWKYIFTKQKVAFEKSQDMDFIKYGKYMFVKLENSWVIMGIDRGADRYSNTESEGQEIEYKYTYQLKNSTY